MNRLRPLEDRLRSLSPASEPEAWAVVAYRLGVALTEIAAGESARSEADLRRALELFDRAAALLDEARAPLEHARIVNASGAAWRAIGDVVRATAAFERAAQLMRGRARPAESIAAWSNLGLTLLEGGQLTQAIAMFDVALAEVPPDVLARADAELIRAYGSTVLNRAQASLAQVDAMPQGAGSSVATEILNGAQSAVGRALAVISPDAAPMQFGMLHHTCGLLRMRAGRAESARESFSACLTVFTRAAFPFQYAIASFNRGRAHEANGDLLWALIDYEAATHVLDPRLHRDQWSEGARRLTELEARLRAGAPQARRIDHVAALAATLDPGPRLSLLRERISRLVGLPVAHQQRELVTWFSAALALDAHDHDALVRSTLEVLMELPEDVLRSALLATLDAHSLLDDNDRVAADRRLDAAIQELVLGPQRVRMRDILYDAGWERP